MRKLKNLTYMQGNIDVSVIKKFGFKLCCVDWFWNVQSSIRSSIPEYSSTMPKLTNNQGLIICPDCVINHFTLSNIGIGVKE